MKTNTLSVILYLGLCITFFTCEKEDTTIDQQDHFKTVSIDDAIRFLDHNHLNTASRNPNEDTYLTSISTDMVQEEITHSDELITVVPVTTIYNSHYSRVLLLEVEGHIQSVVYSMFSNTDTTTDLFSGEMIITDLHGQFLKGYRAENGIVVSELVNLNGTANRNTDNSCSVHGACEDADAGCAMCNNDLGEVVIIANPVPRVHDLVLHRIFDFSIGSGSFGSGWNAGGSSLPNVTPYQAFLNSLSIAQLDFLNLTVNIPLKIAIQDFFDEHGHTQEIENHIKNKLIFLMNNPNGKFDFATIVNSENALHFDSFEDFQDFLNNIRSSEPEIDFETDIFDPRKVTAKFKFDIDIYSSVNIHINQKIDSDLSTYEVLDVNSHASGFTFGMTWTQDSWDSNILPSLADFDVYGHVTLHLFINGIGDFYTENFHYGMQTNINNGQPLPGGGIIED
ncbi:hypothetical protein [uncultured Winogradskyella sp.]|uniref:hypothetical protein n=1 Tax=uncultured Winogradskyella sp. TaxID=395353 RepID=UPI0026283256|nr:hypothetical protein [uncultured Winogradskyella sp.]